MLVRRSAAPSPRPPSRLAHHVMLWACEADRPSAGDFFETGNEHPVANALGRCLRPEWAEPLSLVFKHVPDCAGKSVVASEMSDVPAHGFSRFCRTQPLSAAIECEFQQVAAFKCIKHWEPSEMCPELAHRLVNMPPIRRAMEVTHA